MTVPVTLKIATPRIRNSPPLRRVPDMSHSVHTVSPSSADLGTRAAMSGTPAKICVQFVRTCSLPRKLRCGCAGVSLTKPSAKQDTSASMSCAFTAPTRRFSTTRAPWTVASMTTPPNFVTLSCNRYVSMELINGPGQEQETLRLQRPPGPSPTQQGCGARRCPAQVPRGRVRRHHHRRDRPRGRRLCRDGLQGVRREVRAGPQHLRARAARTRINPRLRTLRL